MNYNSDKPIESSEQDLLGRTIFSKQLGEAIYKYDGKDGLVIGVFGKWGTGKTSILNMVVNEINYLSDNDDDSPIIYNWNFHWFNWFGDFDASILEDLVGFKCKLQNKSEK